MKQQKRRRLIKYSSIIYVSRLIELLLVRTKFQPKRHNYWTVASYASKKELRWILHFPESERNTKQTQTFPTCTWFTWHLVFLLQSLDSPWFFHSSLSMIASAAVTICMKVYNIMVYTNFIRELQWKLCFSWWPTISTRSNNSKSIDEIISCSSLDSYQNR